MGPKSRFTGDSQTLCTCANNHVQKAWIVLKSSQNCGQTSVQVIMQISHWNAHFANISVNILLNCAINYSQLLPWFAENMRNKHPPRRGGNASRNASSRSTPKKDSKTDKSKGLANHIFTCGKSKVDLDHGCVFGMRRSSSARCWTEQGIRMTRIWWLRQ